MRHLGFVERAGPGALLLVAVIGGLAPACGDEFETVSNAEGGEGGNPPAGEAGGADSNGGSGATPAGSAGEEPGDGGSNGSATGTGGVGGMGSLGGFPAVGGASGSGASDASGGTDSGSSGGAGATTAGAGGATTGGSGGATTGGSGNSPLVQDLVDEDNVVVREIADTVAALAWWYHDTAFVPFDPSLGTLESVTVEESIELEFEIPPGTLGDSFRHSFTLFKDDGARVIASQTQTFEVSSTEMSKTYTWEYPASDEWSEPGWRYYFEIRAEETPFYFRNVTRITYHLAEEE